VLAELLLQRAMTVALIATRLAGFVIVSPFPGESTPRQVRVGFVLLLTWFIASTDEPVAPASSPELGYEALFGVTSELAIGVLVGLAFRTVIGAAEIGGELCSQATGLGSASLFNPTTRAQETPISRLFWLAGAALILTTGTHRVVLGYLIETFGAIPLGTGIAPGGAAPALLDLVAGSMVAGLRLAFPVIAVGLVAQVGLALVARIAPALGVFQIGLPVLVAAGLIVLGLSFPSVVSLLTTILAGTPAAVEQLLRDASG